MHLGLNDFNFVVLGGLNRGIVNIGSCIGDVGVGNIDIGIFIFCIVVPFIRQVELVTVGRLLISINLL